MWFARNLIAIVSNPVPIARNLVIMARNLMPEICYHLPEIWYQSLIGQHMISHIFRQLKPSHFNTQYNYININENNVHNNNVNINNINKASQVIHRSGKLPSSWRRGGDEADLGTRLG